MFKDADASRAAFEELKAKRYIRYENLPLKTKRGQQINVEFISNVYREGGKNVVQCNIRDITERVGAEESEQQKLQGQKMEAVGQLAGGLAHDFNNLLGVILGYCEVLDEAHELSGSSRTMVHEIRHAGVSAKNLTQRLLAFSRRQLLQPVLLHLNESISGMNTMLGRLLGDNIEIVSVLAEDAGTIKADPSQLELVLMNLAINARDAMPDGGRIVIETHNVEVDDTYAEQHPSVGTGRHVMLTVSDTGVGMDAETKSHVFEPFFSTKPVGEGTGLGLSTVFGIVAQSGGAVTVYSEPNRGTTFKILFPRYNETPAVRMGGSTKALQSGTETILLVDDATSLRLLTKKLLEQSGYTVIDTGDPQEALRLAAEHRGHLHLMITDVVMPVLSGPVLAQKMSVLRPEAKVLYTSGYTDSSLVRLHVPSRAYAFLGKPFTRAETDRQSSGGFRFRTDVCRSWPGPGIRLILPRSTSRKASTGALSFWHCFCYNIGTGPRTCGVASCASWTASRDGRFERMAKAMWNGQVLAESETTETVEGNTYFPEESVKREFLRPSSTTSSCPWKGQARYYTVIVDGQENPDAAWYYPDPKPAARAVKHHVAFWRGVEVSK